WPGRLMSSVYCPFPVTNRKSSLRRTAAPIPVALMKTPPRCEVIASPALLGRLLRGPPHGAGARRDRFHDVVVAGAAAEIAFELFANGALIELVAEPVDHVDRGHDHAGGAESALQPMVLAERLLHRMQLFPVCEAFDGQHAGTLGLHRQHGA